jgi:cyclopropane fatty-acyl-phospholipid synthase-like methyltransferase
VSCAGQWAAEQRDCLARRRLDGLSQLWRATPDAYVKVKATLACVAQAQETERAGAADHYRVAQWAQAFDHAAEMTGDCGVALYALGRSDLLAAATREVLDSLASWNVLRPGQFILDIGCGSGRLLEKLAGSAALAVGIDVSPGMLRRAQMRCGSLPRAAVVATSGRDLDAFRDGSFDIALAVDSFPYIVSAGPGLVDAFAAGAARLLRAMGTLLILNYSYRNDPAADRRDVAELASRHGFDVVRNGTRDFALWDARTYLLRRCR